MNQTRQLLFSTWNHFQCALFPWIQDELGSLTKKQEKLIQVLEMSRVESHLPYMGNAVGRPSSNRSAILRAFVAKAVYSLPTTEVLLDNLKSSTTLRRLCGWEKMSDVPSASTFSRAFSEFSDGQLAERIHAAVIDEYLGEQVIGHIPRDSTAINAREKPKKKEAV